MHVSLDLLFLDSDYLVVAAVKSLRPGGSCPEMKEAVGVLELAAGTIRLSQTEKGDHMRRSIRAPMDSPRVRAPQLLSVSDAWTAFPDDSSLHPKFHRREASAGSRRRWW